MVSENKLHLDNLIQPIFLISGNNKEKKLKQWKGLKENQLIFK